MGELKRLKRERDKLISQRKVVEAMKERNVEKAKLRTEIRREKHPTLYRVGGSFIKAAKKSKPYLTKKSLKFVSKKARRIIPKQQKKSKKHRSDFSSINQVLYGG